MSLIKRLADNSKHSLAQSFRRKRFALFTKLLSSVPRPMRILDVGGTERFWHFMEFGDEAGVEITILNNQVAELISAENTGRTEFKHAIGDARDMPEFSAGEFDVVFSNSVLEHVGNYDDQRNMLREIERVGKSYFVQTPNYFFPLEPHFHVLGFQFLPVSVRTFLLQHFDLGWTAKIKDPSVAEEVVRSVRLLSAGELRRLCPLATLYRERAIGLTKSFVLYNGFDV